MKDIKLTKYSKFLLIIQTILTLGLNWVYFLAFYYLDQKAVNFYTNQVGYNPKKRSVLKYVSFVALTVAVSLGVLIYFVIREESIYSITDPLFYVRRTLDQVSLFSWLLIPAVLVAVVIVYKQLVQSVYVYIYERKFSKAEDVVAQFTTTVVLSVVTLGWFLLQYLYRITLYELYILYINKECNRKEYKLTRISKGLIILTTIIYIITLAYCVLFYQSIHWLMLYLIVLSLLMPLLNLGMYEFKMRLILDNKLEYLSINREQDHKHNESMHKFLFTVYTIVVFGLILVAMLRLAEPDQDNEGQLFNYDMRSLKCEDYKDNTIRVCFKKQHNQNNINNLLVGLKPEDEHMITDFQSPEDISSEPIQYTNSGDTVYSSKAKLINYTKDEDDRDKSHRYFYIKSYYKKTAQNQYVPLFNVVKTLGVNGVSYDQGEKAYIEISNNDVYLYNHLTGDFSRYNEQFNSIDTTRLIISNLNVSVHSSSENIYGHTVDNGSPYIKMDDYKNDLMKYHTVGLVDQTMLSHLMLSHYDQLKKLDATGSKFPNVMDLLDAKYNPDSVLENLSYPNDRYYLTVQLYKHIHVFSSDEIDLHTVSKAPEPDESFESTYLNQTIGAPKLMTNSSELDGKVYASSTIHFNIPEEQRILYGYEISTGSNDMEFKTFDILYNDTEEDYEIDTTFTYTIQSIKQYFNDESIHEETITVHSSGN